MTTTLQQFQLNLVQEFFKAGGPNTKFDQRDSTDELRPLLQGTISDGFQVDYIGPVEVTLSFIDLVADESIYQQNCFEFACIDDDNPLDVKVHRLFQESGIESFIPNVSDICFTRWAPNPNVPTSYEFAFVDKINHVSLPFAQCFVDEFDRERYFIRSTPDTNNAVYVADIGYLTLIGRTKVIVERNVPLFRTAQPGVLRGTSLIPISSGIKFATIKKVTASTIETIQTIYGELREDFYIPHITLKANRELNNVDQSINLENLSINLILLTSFKRFLSVENQIVYRSANYSSPLLESTLQASANSLQAFINLIEDIPQTGTIPEFITNYLTSANDYNSEADSLYTAEVISCFDAECYDADCFTNFLNQTVIYRSISNRALAWTVIFFSGYLVAYSDDSFIDSVELISNYLLKERNFNRLHYKGWIDPVLYDEYDNMVRDTTVDCSTQCAVFLALLKTFEVTQDFKYLEDACLLHNNIEKYFLNNNGTYNHSLTTRHPSVESVIYQLLIAEALQDYTHIDSILQFLNTRLNALPPNQSRSVILNNGDNVITSGGDNVVLQPAITIDAETDNVLFTPTEYDTFTSIDDIYKYNYLAFSTLERLSTKITVSFIDALRLKDSFIFDDIVTDRLDASLMTSLANLIDNISLFDIDSIRWNSVVDFYNLKFNIENSFINLINKLPTDYNWFKPEVLNRTSNLGKMLYSFATGNGQIFTRIAFLERVSNIFNMYGQLLNQKAADFSLERFNKETDDSLRGRILTEILREANTKESIQRRLDLYDNPVEIFDNHNIISSYESIDITPFQNRWGVGYIQGPEIATTNAVSIMSHQPVEPDVYELLTDIKPVGVSIEVIENLTFTVGSGIEDGTGFKMTDISGGCDNIKTEDANDIILEADGANICLEDEETIITTLPPLPPPPPPEQQGDEAEDTCDCEWLRGYISINTIPTELRTMRLVEEPIGNFFYDVNATNDDTEPCDLFIQTSLVNNSLKYLQVEELPTLPPADFINVRGISHIFPLTSSSYLIIWYSGTLSQHRVSVTDFVTTTTNNIPGDIDTVFELLDYLVIISGSNLITVEKATAVVNTISTPFAANGSDYQFVSLTNTTVGIYSGLSNDDTIYHYIFDESTPTVVTTLNSVLMLDTRRHRYFNANQGLVRYSFSNADTEIYNTPGFDELGILDVSVSSPIFSGSLLNSSQKIYLSNRDDQVFINVIGVPTVFSTLNISLQIGQLVSPKQDGSVVYDLQYLDANNYNFKQTGESLQVDKVVLTKGTNNVLGIESNSYETFNNFVCPTDTVNLPSNYVIQSIDFNPFVENGVIISAVDLSTATWIVRNVSVVNKECS